MRLDKDGRRRRRKEQENQKHRRFLAEKQRIANTAARQALYPEFRLNLGNAPTELAQLVQEALNRLDFEDDRFFDEQMRHFYRQQKEFGFRAALESHGLALESKDFNAHYDSLVLATRPGVALFKLMAQDQLRKFLPFHDVVFQPSGNAWQVVIRSLESRRTPRGVIYYSPHRPTVLIDGKPCLVAFHRHAIERASERMMASDWENYLGMGDLFGYFYECTYFEPCQLQPDGLGLAFYWVCPERHHIESHIADSVIPGRDLTKKWYLKAGYYRCAVYGDTIEAITCLFPGYTATPEYFALKKATLPRSEQAKMLTLARNQTMRSLTRTRDYSLIKWFHDAGIPQVKSIDGDIFKAFAQNSK